MKNGILYPAISLINKILKSINFVNYENSFIKECLSFKRQVYFVVLTEI